MACYRKGHKSDLRKLNSRGVVCVEDPDFSRLDDFVRIYQETMARLDATEYYRFDHDYFAALATDLREWLHLFVCLLDGQVICAGLFTLCQGIVQYHLSGTSEGHSELAPTKLMLDTVRRWANERGAWAFHLGGGVGGHEDSFFAFKSGFSSRRHEFPLWHWTVLPEVYADLREARDDWERSQGRQPEPTSFFPAYRRPN